MSEYYAVRRDGQDDHLEHLFGFGGQKKNHKYVARVKEGDSYRYFYSHAEYAAYMAGGAAKAVGNAAKGATDAAGNAAKSAAGAVGNAIGVGKKKDLDKKFAESERIRKGIAAKRGPNHAYSPDDPIERARDAAYKRSTEKVIKAREAYDKTLLGKADAAGDLAKRATKAAGSAAKGAAKGAANATINTINAAGGAVDGALKKARNVKLPKPKPINSFFRVTKGNKAKKQAEDRKKSYSGDEYETSTRKIGPVTIRVSKKKKKR